MRAGRRTEAEKAEVRVGGPWDARLARAVVRPFAGTALHPNHVTTLGLGVGLAAAALYASGGGAAWGGALYLSSAVLDHADGELARMTGKTSAFGHAYDRAVDLAVKTAVFTGIGIGLRHGPLGNWSVVLGVCAGVAFVAIFLLRSAIARRRGTAVLGQPSFAGFELEDILYIVAPITWLGWLSPFLVAAGIGAPLFALWVAAQYRASATALLERVECPS